jgi:hypothetical protein
MNDVTFQGLMDELEKISTRLTKGEKRERAAKFMALGTLSGPVIAGTGGLLRGGKGSIIKNLTQDTKFRRWFPATLVTGALVSGAIPASRHVIERNIIEKAKDRERREGKR